MNHLTQIWNIYVWKQIPLPRLFPPSNLHSLSLSHSRSHRKWTSLNSNLSAPTATTQEPKPLIQRCRTFSDRFADPWCSGPQAATTEGSPVAWSRRSAPPSGDRESDFSRTLRSERCLRSPRTTRRRSGGARASWSGAARSVGSTWGWTSTPESCSPWNRLITYLYLRVDWFMDLVLKFWWFYLVGFDCGE